MLRPLQVVADTANGMGGLVVPAVFEGLPFDLEILFGELDGTFPNHPADPIQPENLADLQRAVLDAGADVGLAFDGDADRVFLVDDQGAAGLGLDHDGDRRQGHPRARHPGETIVHNLICSKAVPEVIRENGGMPGAHPRRPLVHQAGDGRDRRHLRRRALGALLLPRQLAGRLRLIAALMVLEQLSLGRRAAVGAAQAVRALRAVGRDQHRGRRPAAVIERVAGHVRATPSRTGSTGSPSTSATGGSTCAPSNTEPLLRLNLEAADAAACDAHTAEVLALVAAPTTA